jgi:hypothetical protein
MRATKVGAVRSNGQYGNDSVSIEIELERGELAAHAFEMARHFCIERLPGGRIVQAEEATKRAVRIEADAECLRLQATESEKQAQAYRSDAAALLDASDQDIPF